MSSERAGKYIKLGGARSFRPAPLPPSPPIEIDAEFATTLSRADRALARLDGAIATIPDPDMLVFAFMRQEAVLSSQIEGTEASLEDLLEFEADKNSVAHASDVRDVVNYLDAVTWAVERIRSKPISLNLLKDTHRRLLKSGRGATRGAGEFRKSQNWIGKPGCELKDATFVPPSTPDMTKALHDLETFIHTTEDIPELVLCALVHAQFETIHPFWDGNGRLGRMLITLMLCEREILERPVLYLSLFFKSHRDEYYELLQRVRDHGDWEEWIKFFLRGVARTSRSALQAATLIRQLRDELIAKAPKISGSPNATAFGELMFRRPYLTAKHVSEELGVSPPTANSLIRSYERARLLRNVTGRARGRVFAFKPYLDILHDCANDLSDVLKDTDHLATHGG
jgi:Fic family protein